MHYRKLTGLAIVLVVSAGMACGLSGCGGHDERTDQVQPGRNVPSRTQVVVVSRVATVHASPATVVAVERAEVASRLMGYIRDIAVTEGQSVTRGQRLFSVDPIDVQGQVDQARLAVSQAESAYVDARADLERFTNLYKEEAVSRQQFDKTKLQYDLTSTRLEQAKAAQVTAAGQLRYATVTAPMAGVVTKKLANAGDLAAPGRPLLVLENPARLQVETQVPESVLRSLRPGMSVPVEVDGVAGLVDGRVAEVSPAADPVSRTFLVKLNVNAVGLRSGVFARVLFPTGEREVLAVPRAAIVNRAGIEGAFVVDAQGVAQFRMLRSGAEQDGQVEIQAGLEPGERLVVEGAARLESGDKVTEAGAAKPTGKPANQ